MRSSAGTVALTIAPLAAVSLATTARGQTVFQVPSASSYNPGSGGTIIYNEGVYSASGFAASALPSYNGITGVIVMSSGSFIASSGYTNQTAVLTLGETANITGSSLPAETTLPISYNFTLNSAGAVSAVSWALNVNIGSLPEQVASGTGLGTFSGNTSYVIDTPLNTPKSYFSELDFTFTTQTTNNTLEVEMNGGQGVSINPAPIAVPEPATTGAYFGLGALLLVLIRRWRREPAV